MPSLRIDIGCDLCGGQHEIFVPTNLVDTSRSYRFDCPDRNKPVEMPANSFLSLEAVAKIPESGRVAAIV